MAHSAPKGGAAAEKADALAQLAQVGSGQPDIQLGLAEQHDLQQLAGLGLQVAEQPDGLQGLVRQGLRLVDQHHHSAPLLVQGDEVAMDAIREIQLAVPLHHQPQLQGQGGAQLTRGEVGIGQPGQAHRARL